VSLNKKIIIFGLGAMGGALVRGWIKTKIFSVSNLTAVNLNPQKRKSLVRQLEIRLIVDPTEALKKAQLIVLAVKPQQMKSLLVQVGALFPKKTLIISIAAGISTRQIEKALPQGCPVVRVMPNTPSLLGDGMSAVAGGSRSSHSDIKLVLSLFDAVGKSVEVSEDQMDLVTALSGSGPAYIFNMIEALVEAGVKKGLPEKTALLLASQTAYGAARMVLKTEKSPEELRAQVTSPGGTTQAGLTAMKERGFRESIFAAVEAAMKRSAELRRMNN
jgi:pyrroline-5-carboxylate reductase